MSAASSIGYRYGDAELKVSEDGDMVCVEVNGEAQFVPWEVWQRLNQRLTEDQRNIPKDGDAPS